MRLLAKLGKDKFSRDVIWNIASLGVAGVFGVAINIVIGLVYGSAALGVFNQVFALYLLLSQFVLFGCFGVNAENATGSLASREAPRSETRTKRSGVGLSPSRPSPLR